MPDTTYGKWAGGATVNQGVDRVGLVDVVVCEDLGGEVGVVVGDQLGEIVGDHVGVRVAQAERISWLRPAVARNGGASEHGRGEGENGGGTHDGCYFGMGDGSDGWCFWDGGREVVIRCARSNGWTRLENE